MSELFFMRDIVDQFGPIVAMTSDMSHLVAWNGDSMFYLFDTGTFNGEYAKVFGWMSDSINATSSVNDEVIMYAFEWLEDEVG